MEELSRTVVPRFLAAVEAKGDREVTAKDRLFAGRREHAAATELLGENAVVQQSMADARLAQAPSAPCYVKMLISNQLAGMIIGNTGQEIKHLKQITGAKIVLSPHGMYFPGTTERLVAAEGTERAVFQVVDWIIDRMDELAQLAPPSQPSSAEDLLRPTTSSLSSGSAGLQPRALACKICVPRAVIGSLIGRKGGYIQSVRLATEANINISPLFVTADEACAERVVTVESTRKQSLRTAVFTLARKINTHPEKATCKHVCYYRKLNFESPPAVAERGHRQPRPRNQIQNAISRNAFFDAASDATGHNGDVDLLCTSTSSSFGANSMTSRSSLSKIGGGAGAISSHDEFGAFEAFSIAHARHSSRLVSRTSESLKAFGQHPSQPSLDASTGVDSGSDEGVVSATRGEHLPGRHPAGGICDARAEFLQSPQKTTVVRRGEMSALGAPGRTAGAADAAATLHLYLKQAASLGGERGPQGPDAADGEGANMDVCHDTPSTVCSTAAGSMARLASILQCIQEESEQHEWKGAGASGAPRQRSGLSTKATVSTLDASAPEFFPLRPRSEESLGEARKTAMGTSRRTCGVRETALGAGLPAEEERRHLETSLHQSTEGKAEEGPEASKQFIEIADVLESERAAETKTSLEVRANRQTTASKGVESKSADVADGTSTEGPRSGLIRITALFDEGFMAFMKMWTLALVLGLVAFIAAKSFFVEW
ncbi:putative KH domain-containing protein [Neospora caninum Liverpool]|uniref:KH domain-containing protein, putative n=1 Tax=Neospora caninum (strain Liverpool) TaxID=572307 RepID=F0VD02_NEOCL|nr:putative KH domain-containing protein [Neospora caninum Liverpool]CBZ51517.1 putative KH domain-containing protein [Neospora caninum Liverpool]CEL65466.1 TPA: KH domain-containing protein, putative [Neospora caninum Liverpool]|eukprot:XP_003881550.1 putative KH domain-containing protein [Neospora caninum Liverpool]